jgi:hypothetical protein
LRKEIEEAKLPAPEEIKKILEVLTTYTCKGQNAEKELRNYLIQLKKILSNKYSNSEEQ